ncbi:MAG: hypothetical protein ACR2RV_28700 [Verrucomicrobiales bacterium]
MKYAFCVLIALATLPARGAGSPDQLTWQSLGELHELLQPRAEELVWRDSIPWRTDLWEARQEAAAAGKPIFLWEMDGHPLGCT